MASDIITSNGEKYRCQGTCFCYFKLFLFIFVDEIELECTQASLSHDLTRFEASVACFQT